MIKVKALSGIIHIFLAMPAGFDIDVQNLFNNTFNPK